MSEDYASAAKRHRKDATLLEGVDRIDNADHLYGLSAECALKFALSSVGAFSDGHKTHINTLLRRIQWTRLQTTFPGLARLSGLSASFDDWCVSQRYRADGSVCPTTLAKHKEMARRILHAVNLARG